MKFTTLSDAIEVVVDYSTNRTVIYVKKGVYNEYLEVRKKKWYVMLVGDGMNVTVISGNHSFIGGWTTYRSVTFGNSFLTRFLIDSYLLFNLR